jgi:outer membrane protein assembly factor BamD
MKRSYQLFVILVGALAFFLLSGFGLFGHKKYDTPITKETLQPDKVLFDRAIKNIEHGDYEAARLTLNTLINTYDTSEYLAKAKLAIADSWFREGGAHGLAEAEQEYKDFILFYPNMEEAAESQFKICNIHYKQMEKADRDNSQGQRAEDECRQVMVQFPNSKFVPQAQQMLRATQEVLADKEFLTGDFYHHKGSFPAAASRLAYVSRQYPLFSGSDQALWELADSYKHMGDLFEKQEADALSRIVHDYPISDHVDDAKARLVALKQPVPQADRDAYMRMKYEIENRTRPNIIHRVIDPFESHPDVYAAAKTGAPAMAAMRPTVPVSVPAVAAGGQTGVSDVGIAAVGNNDEIDRQKDVRLGQPAAGDPTAPVAPASAPAATGEGEQKAATSEASKPSDAAADSGTTTDAPKALPTNHPPTKEQLKAYKKQVEKAQKAQKEAAKKGEKTTPADAAAAASAAAAPAAAATTPAATPK